MTEREAVLHNQLWNKATSLSRGEHQLDGEPLGPPGFIARWKLNRAAELFRRVLAINPDNGPAHTFLAKTLGRLGFHDEAFEHYCEASRLAPESPGVMREVVLSALSLGKLEEAVRLGREGAERLPSDPGIRVNLGLALLYSGQADQAIEAFQQASSLDPGNEVVRKLVQIAGLVAASRLPVPRNEDEVIAQLEQLESESK